MMRTSSLTATARTLAAGSRDSFDAKEMMIIPHYIMVLIPILTVWWIHRRGARKEYWILADSVLTVCLALLICWRFNHMICTWYGGPLAATGIETVQLPLSILVGHVKGVFGRGGSAFLEPAVYGRRDNRVEVLAERAAARAGLAVYSGGKVWPLREPAFCGVREDEVRSNGL